MEGDRVDASWAFNHRRAAATALQSDTSASAAVASGTTAPRTAAVSSCERKHVSSSWLAHIANLDTLTLNHVTPHIYFNSKALDTRVLVSTRRASLKVTKYK